MLYVCIFLFFFFLLSLQVYNIIDVMVMCVSLCLQISHFLNISCFTIPSPS